MKEDKAETIAVIDLALGLFFLANDPQHDKDTAMLFGLTAFELLEKYLKKLQTGEHVEFTPEANALLDRIANGEFSPKTIQ